MSGDAAECADAQNKFWEMHDCLYENQNNLEAEGLIGYAHDLHLNLKKFSADLQNEQCEDKIQTDFFGGIESGVNGTPQKRQRFFNRFGRLRNIVCELLAGEQSDRQTVTGQKPRAEIYQRFRFPKAQHLMKSFGLATNIGGQGTSAAIHFRITVMSK